MLALTVIFIYGNSMISGTKSFEITGDLIDRFESKYTASSDDSPSGAKDSPTQAQSSPTSSESTAYEAQTESNVGTSSDSSASYQASSERLSSEQQAESQRNAESMAKIYLHNYERAKKNAVLRKAAHICEYALLGFELFALLLINRGMSISTVIYSLCAGLAAADIDETVQIFTGRTSSLIDVWIDIGGVAIGIIVCIAASAIKRKRWSG